MWNLFKSQPIHSVYKTDIHSHLLPGIDDGVQTLEEAEDTIRTLMEIGFNKAITTPHIIGDTYRNTPLIIKSKLTELNSYLQEKGISFRLEVAAEYMLDEYSFDILNNNQELLTFSKNYVLFETSTYNEPPMLNEFIFKLKVKDFIPVMAHPERYKYLFDNWSRIEDLQDRGVLFQVNALSLMDGYSKPIRKVAKEFLDKKLIHFIGSDCHGLKHAGAIKAGLKGKNFQKALELPLLNYTL